MGPPKSPHDTARDAVEQEKEKKWVDDIVQRSHVTVAENFKVEAPATPPSLSPFAPDAGDETPGAPPATPPGKGPKPAAPPKTGKK